MVPPKAEQQRACVHNERQREPCLASAGEVDARMPCLGATIHVAPLPCKSSSKEEKVKKMGKSIDRVGEWNSEGA